MCISVAKNKNMTNYPNSYSLFANSSQLILNNIPLPMWNYSLTY